MSCLKNRILVQGQGGGEFQPAGILKYVEELKQEPNADIGSKDIFEIASKCVAMPKKSFHLKVQEQSSLDILPKDRSSFWHYWLRN